MGGVRPTDFDVHIEPGMPAGYVALGPGGYGAAWLIAGTTQLVGFHLERAEQGGFGVATRLDKVLSALHPDAARQLSVTIGHAWASCVPSLAFSPQEGKQRRRNA